MPLVKFRGLGSSAYLHYFRVSGRASQVSHLRAEFDQGVNYNLVKSDLCDVDPHIISSLFKAYLRACESTRQSFYLLQLTARSQRLNRY